VSTNFYVSYVTIPSDAKEASEYISKLSNYGDLDLGENFIRDNNNSIISI
jgi:hypothetical protein